MTNMTPASPTPAAKPKPRPRPQVMKLTEAAAQRITELTKRADSEIVGLRVGIKNGGCAGQSYTVEYAHEVRPTDEVVEDRGVDIVMTLTTPNCPAAGELPTMVENAVASVPGVGVVNVNLVWDPGWTPDRMSDEARLVLNMW